MLEATWGSYSNMAGCQVTECDVPAMQAPAHAASEPHITMLQRASFFKMAAKVAIGDVFCTQHLHTSQTRNGKSFNPHLVCD